MDEAKGREKRVRRGKRLMGQTKLQGKKKNSVAKIEVEVACWVAEKITRRKGRTEL